MPWILKQVWPDGDALGLMSCTHHCFLSCPSKFALGVLRNRPVQHGQPNALLLISKMRFAPILSLASGGALVSGTGVSIGAS